MAGFETIPLPPKSQVGYLDPSIGGEGGKVVGDKGEGIQFATGETLSFTAPPPKPNYPDWSEIKSIQRYFNRVGYEPWPAWFYHPSQEPRLIKDQAEGKQIGVYYRLPTADETARFGVMRGVWDWADGCEWRPTPYHAPKFDPKNPGHGKEYVDPMRDQGTANRFMVAELAKAISTALQANGPQAPAAVDPHMWDQFQQFLAWRKASEVMGTATMESAAPLPDAPAQASPAPQGTFGGALDQAVNTLSAAVQNGEAKKVHGDKKR
jgi:hypothetical protein